MTGPRNAGRIAAVLASVVAAGCGATGGPCASKATDSCTPHLAADGTVQVDTLQWRIVNIYQAKHFAGLDATGTYVVAVLKVTNRKHSAVMLTDDVVKLSNGGDSYSQDNAVEGALENGDAPGNPTGLTQISPGEAATVTVGFDVPARVLHAQPQLQFNELGGILGTTHGYIKVPLPLSK